MAWAKNGTPDTLSGTSDQLTITDLTTYKFNFWMWEAIAVTGNCNEKYRTGSSTTDTGSNYTSRKSYNGGTDATATSQTEINFGDDFLAVGENKFCVNNTINIASEEKLTITHWVHSNTAGAGTAPQRGEYVMKWTNTSNQFDILEINNGDSGDYTTGSNLSALGTD